MYSAPKTKTSITTPAETANQITILFRRLTFDWTPSGIAREGGPCPVLEKEYFKDRASLDVAYMPPVEAQA